MKKATKLVSGVLAALMATSAFTATGFAAAKTPTKEDCDAAGEQKIYFQFPTDGTWGDHNAVKVSGMTGKGNVYCLIYAVYGNEYEFFNSGWETSVCSCTAEDKDAGLYSYDINSKMTVTLDEIDPATGKKKKTTLYRFMEMNPDVDYGVIFSTSANGGFQTADLNMTCDCIGDTVQLVSPIQTRENAANSNKSDYYSEWKNHKDYKLMANITSTGKFVDGQFPAHQPPAQMLSNKLKEYLTNYINVGYFNNPEKNAAICDKLGVTPKQVYDQYMADNAEFIEGATIYPGQPDDKIATTDDAPVDFIKYMGKDDKGQPKEKKMPAPEAVRAALGVTDEPTTAEPTTAEPTTVEPTTVEPTTVEPTTAAPAEDVYVLAGSSDWLTTGWDPAIDAYVMEKQDDGTYAITVPEVEAGENNYAVKVVKFVGGDEAQKEWYGVNGGNLNYDFMVKTACDVTVTFNPETKEITVTGIGVADPEYPINKLVAVGSGQNGFLNDESWAVDSEANAMTEKSEGVYEIVFDEVGANAEYQVKFAANGGWGMNWGLVKGTEAAVNTPNPAQYNAEDNIVFTPESEDEYVKVTLTLDLSAWDKVTKEGATYTIKVEAVEEPTTVEPTTVEPTTVEPTTAPAEDVYVLAGSSDWLTTGWDPAIDAYVMTKQDDGTYAITVPEVEAGENNYAVKVVKFVGGDEAQKEWYGVNGGNLNYDFMVKTACDVTVTFNPETKEITVTGIGVAEPEYPINKLVAVGSGQNGFLNDESWAVDSEANAMTEKSEGVYEIVFDEVGANAEYQVKFAANGSWGMNWGLVKGTEAAIGTPNPAQYNAEDNIVFTPESEDEYVKITLTLDLSAWDKVTKEGAAYTIKVEPVDEPTGPIMGDVNGDGKVDIADATAIQYASIDLPTEGAFNADLADVNGDGRISILDATCVQKYAAGYTKGIGNAGKVVNPV